MDFKTAQPIIDACVKKAEEGIWGYTSRPDSYFEAVRDWEKRRNNWDVDTNMMSWSLGVVSAMASMIRLFSKGGDKVLIQTPVYSEFCADCRDLTHLRAIKNLTLRRQVFCLWKSKRPQGRIHHNIIIRPTNSCARAFFHFLPRFYAYLANGEFLPNVLQSASLFCKMKE